MKLGASTVGLVLILVLGLVLAMQTGSARTPPDAGAPDAARNTVRIVFQTVPPVRAVVLWGRKPLGTIRGSRRPLVIEPARDSGPLDVVVRADGYLPVHARAHTFSDNKLSIKLTPVTEKRKLLGYREELSEGSVPDGGTPPSGLPPRD